MIDLSITEKLTKLRWHYSSKHLKSKRFEKERPKKVIHHIWGWKPDLRLVDAEHDLNITKWVNRSKNLAALRLKVSFFYCVFVIPNNQPGWWCWVQGSLLWAFSHFLASRLTQLHSLAICKQSIWRHWRYVLQTLIMIWLRYFGYRISKKIYLARG